MRSTWTINCARLVIAMLPTLVLAVSPAQAQGGPSFSVGQISSAKSCTVYEESAGRAGVVVTPHLVAAYESWRTWLVKDCVDHFASLRTSLQAALASAGSLAIRTRGGHYSVSGVISDVSGGGDRPTPEAPDGMKFAISRNLMTVNMDIVVRDGAGPVVFGGVLTKTIEVGSDIKTGDYRATSNMSGEAGYTRLQHEVAQAVARMVAFHFDPLRITMVNGKIIGLNYGAPLLPLGTIVQAIGADGLPLRYHVIAAADGSSTAQLDGDGDYQSLQPGAPVTAIEADDPAANQRRFNRVDLP